MVYPPLEGLGPQPIPPSLANDANNAISPPSILNQIIEASVYPAASPLTMPKELNKAELEAQIDQLIKEVAKGLEDIEQKKEATATTDTISSTIRGVIVETVLKTGSDIAKTGISFLLRTPADAIRGLVPTVDIIKIVSEGIDFGTGLVSLIYKAYVIDIALKEIDQLKKRKLTPLEKNRLEDLEKNLKFEQKELKEKASEEGLKSIKTVFSYLSFGFEWAEKNPAIHASLTASQQTLTALGVALAGHSFYRAHQKLKAHDEWKDDFKVWLDRQIPRLEKGEVILNEKPAAHRFLAYFSNQIVNDKKSFQDSLEKYLGAYSYKPETVDILYSLLQKINQNEEMQRKNEREIGAVSLRINEEIHATASSEVAFQEQLSHPPVSLQEQLARAAATNTQLKTELEKLLASLEVNLSKPRVKLDKEEKETPRSEIHDPISIILQNRKSREELQLEEVRKSHSMEGVQQFLIEIRRPALHRFLIDPSNKQLDSPHTFKELLEKQLGSPVDGEIVDALYAASVQQRRLLQKIEKYEKLQRETETLVELLERDISSQQLQEIGASVSSLQEQLFQATAKNGQIKEALNSFKASVEINNSELKKIETASIRPLIEKLTEKEQLKSYVDYHSVLDPAIKNSLSELLKKKHEVEHNILKMKKVSSGSQFIAAGIIFSVALAFLIVSLVATPIGAAGLILTILSVGSTVLGLGFTVGDLLKYGQRPGMATATLKGEYIRLNYYNIRAALSSLKEKIVDYFTAIKQESRDQEDEKIEQLAKSDLDGKKQKEKQTHNDDLLREEIRQKEIAAERQSKIWQAKAEALNEQLEEIAWKDLAIEADLVDIKQTATGVQFNTLETLNHLLTTCNLELLSKETKELLKIQLGINIETLQNEIMQDPLSVKRLIRNLFNLDEGAFGQFIAKQKILRNSLLTAHA